MKDKPRHLRAVALSTRSLPTLHRVGWLATLLGISEKQTYEAIAAKQIPPEIILRFGRRIRVVEEKAIEWIMRGDSSEAGSAC